MDKERLNQISKLNITINKLQQFYKSYNPGFSFDYKFLDDDYQAQYVSEQRISVLSKYFGGIAIVISCFRPVKSRRRLISPGW